ncbi:MAG: lipocalin family protein [Candidatus Limnocylindrales bacterium]
MRSASTARRSSLARRFLLAGFVAVLVGGCTGPILAQPQASRAPGPSSTASPPAAVDPRPVRLPADDAAHDRLTEWWYYTGHLRDAQGARYGFEFVVFRAERGGFPVSWASHLAITDEGGQAFHFAQRSEIGPQVDRSPGAVGARTGFDLRLLRAAAGQADPGPSPTLSPATAWAMRGGDGHDRLTAGATPDEAAAAGSPGGLGLDLTVTATAPATLQDVDGWVDFGPAGGSYYYSRTKMAADGALTLDGRTFQVSGTAWFDHQWGDFISVGGGGWDWFAINLADGTDLTLSLVRAADGSYPLVYGTLVDGRPRHLRAADFRVTPTGHWRSPRTGVDYPSGWLVELPGEGLRIELDPSVPDQELDTRASTGVVYWEGSQVVTASRAGQTIAGEGYVELTGYRP